MTSEPDTCIMVYMMTKKSTRSTATFANVYTMLDRDELRANAVPVEEANRTFERLNITQRKIDADLIERLQGLNRSAADRRRYYEAS